MRGSWFCVTTRLISLLRMRTTYGKLIYMLMDAQIPEVKNLLDFSCVRPIKTVYSVLEEYGALDVLKDDLITAGSYCTFSPALLLILVTQPLAKYILRAVPDATSKRTSVLKSVPSKLSLLDMLVPPSVLTTFVNASIA